MSGENADSIARLLEETEAAHGEYEATVLGGVRDERWSDWYATYLVDHGLLELLPDRRRSDAAGLAAILVGLDSDYRREHPAIAWPEYYAARLTAIAEERGHTDRA